MDNRTEADAWRFHLNHVKGQTKKLGQKRTWSAFGHEYMELNCLC